MNKKDLSERDICTKYITPALKQAGWEIHSQIREEVTLTAGRVIVKGQIGMRTKGKRADYVRYHKPNIPLAVVEAKDNKHSIGAGIQQAQGYADILDVPFVFSSNGDGFLFHDRTGLFPQVEQELSNDQFPNPEELWGKFQQWKGYKPEETSVITQDYYEDGSGKSPRYYQMHAINKTVEAVARGQDRALLVMATGCQNISLIAGIEYPKYLRVVLRFENWLGLNMLYAWVSLICTKLINEEYQYCNK